MKTRLLAAVVTLLLLGASAPAHRLDEYLQATIFSLEKDRVHFSLRLIPGVAVSSQVLAAIDANSDGVFSPAEQQAYAERVLRDLSLSVDGHLLAPRLVSLSFPPLDQMQEGLGEIDLEFTADLPSPVGPHRTLVFQNQHAPRISAYLVNCLVPSDPDLRVLAQTRNENQSFYQLDYTQDHGLSSSLFSQWQSAFRRWSGAVGFASLFRLGLRHIAEGTDHLLFLLALLLPAPLLVLGSRWSGFAGIRQSLLRILKVVTAFTVGHSLTLALAALGFVHVPSRPVEVLIALSILLSAVHAFRPLFPGREPAIAAFFGLIHGLAFASTLGQLGLGWWPRLASILAFNVGIETMQLLVVAAALPSLLLLSTTRAYPALRIAGALFAAAASTGWIAERLLHLPSAADPVVNAIARRAPWLAAALFLLSLASRALPQLLKSPRRASPTITAGA